MSMGNLACSEEQQIVVDNGYLYLLSSFILV